MSNRTIPLTDSLYAYLLSVSLREPPLFARLREENVHHPRASMQIAPEEGQLLALFVRLLGAKRVLEVGVFTGYSALWMASALPPGGQLVGCDVSEEWTAVARRYFAEAGLSDRLDLRLAPALETLAALEAESESGAGGGGGAGEPFDLAFLDADKEEYLAYYEASLRLLRPGGLVVVDNTLWGGRTADPAVTDAETRAIRAFNSHVHADPRVDISLVPIGDGLTLARKR